VHRPASLLLLGLSLGGLPGCAGLTPLGVLERERLATFDFYWQQLADHYPLFGQHRVPWHELRARYRAAVPFARRSHEFYHLLVGMFSELGDVHVAFRAPEDRWLDYGTPPSSLMDLPGFDLMPIEGRLHVVGWPRGQEPVVPEHLRDAPSWPELARVQGFPVVPSLVPDLLRGPPGMDIELVLRWDAGTETHHRLRLPPAPLPTPRSPLWHLEGSGFERVPYERDFHWLRLSSLGKDLPLDEIDRAIDEANHSQGIVLDLRQNLGGRWDVTQRIVERFLREPLDLVVVPPQPGAAFGSVWSVEVFQRATWTPHEKVFVRPVVVLTSAMTASMAEHMARLLQRHAGAIVVGERTAGAEAGLYEVQGPDGGWLAFGATRIVDRTGVGLQAQGVVPDVSVRLTRDDVERLGAEDAIADWDERLLRAVEQAIVRRPRR
jgi:hypothetical protein